MKQTESPAIRAIQEIKKAVIGKDDCIIKVMTAILAGGHILIEDVPGVGKTTLALAFSKALHLEQNRIQFTPDVLPGDVTGFSLYQKATGTFEYQPGAVMCNLLLADEINRTSPKTQAALLEVMEEGSVSVDGVTRKLDAPFFVIATQNPTGASGTQKLPDSQLDRFFIRLSLGYPDHTAATEILMGHSSGNMDSVQPVLTGETLLGMQKQAEDVYTAPALIDYIVTLTEATRVHEYLLQGISPRGSIALLKMARAYAFYMDRDYLVPEDIHAVFLSVCSHRVILNTKARAAGLSAEDVLSQVLKSVRIPLLSPAR